MPGDATPANLLKAGDVFERHGRTWTVEHVVRGWYGSIHVLCVGGGEVWFPQKADVVVTATQVNLRE